MNLGDLAKKLLVKPIVSVGKAIGRDYQNTVYGPDWRERALMRREMFKSRQAESKARADRDTAEAGYNEDYKRALTGKVTAEAEERHSKQRSIEVAAQKHGMSSDEYLALLDETDRSLKAAQAESLMGYRAGMVGIGERRADAWESLIPSLKARNLAGAAASQHSADRPFTSPRSTSPARVSSDSKALMESAFSTGDPTKIKRAAGRLRVYGKTAVINSFGEDSPILPLIYPEDSGGAE